MSCERRRWAGVQGESGKESEGEGGGGGSRHASRVAARRVAHGAAELLARPVSQSVPAARVTAPDGVVVVRPQEEQLWSSSRTYL